MSLTEFYVQYDVAEQYDRAVIACCWLDRHRLHEGCREHGIVGKRRPFLCHGCQAEVSKRIGMIFSKSLMPLTKWFLADGRD